MVTEQTVEIEANSQMQANERARNQYPHVDRTKAGGKVKEAGQSRSRGSSNSDSGERSMHWIYFLIVGWWAGFMVMSLILPLFYPGGRRFTSAAFGYW